MECEFSISRLLVCLFPWNEVPRRKKFPAKIGFCFLKTRLIRNQCHFVKPRYNDCINSIVL